MYYKIHINWYANKKIIKTQKIGHFINRPQAHKVLDGIVKIYKPIYHTEQAYVLRKNCKTGRILATFTLIAYREENEIGYKSCNFYPCYL